MYKEQKKGRYVDSYAEIGSLLKNIVKKGKKKKATKVDDLAREWEEVIGPKLQSMTKVIGFKNNNMIISVSSPVVLAEMQTGIKEKILRKIKERNNISIENIVFKT